MEHVLVGFSESISLLQRSVISLLQSAKKICNFWASSILVELIEMFLINADILRLA